MIWCPKNTHQADSETPHACPTSPPPPPPPPRPLRFDAENTRKIERLRGFASYAFTKHSSLILETYILCDKSSRSFQKQFSLLTKIV